MSQAVPKTSAKTGGFRTKRELAIGTLRDAIQEGRYVPGQRLSQAQLMSDLGLGSTPARDAILELLARGVLVQESHHSVRVAELNLPRLRNIYRVRLLLEVEAAQLGSAKLTEDDLVAMTTQVERMEAARQANDPAEAGRADLQFRRILYGAADNVILFDLIDQVWLSFPGSILLAIPGRLERSIAEHYEILKALTRRDPTAVGYCVQKHLLAALDVLETYVEEYLARSGSDD
ncbi:GntR family transcriptional regulator [Phenylobacterium sp.]|uniref:GntR family transcriptional regulator n=1 Tax=Phenylobacterium sp. TaxID=1871053 RepID=UPI00120C1194|nr:GntR family transcriptional regulator [Phenylobacterium sp.]THD64480.1 MAG: GntR family transcriptional regulator [Phenylobacterium sp.]